MKVTVGLAAALASAIVFAHPASAQTPKASVSPSPRRVAQPTKDMQYVERPAPQGFSVVLVVGDLQTGTTQDNVPPAARKALADMKDFLPYKAYRLLDVQWTLCCGRTPLVSRLRGVDGHDYELTLTTATDQRSRLSVRFLLRDPAVGATGPADLPSLQARELVRELRTEQDRLEKALATAMTRARQRAQTWQQRSVQDSPDVIEARSRLANVTARLQEAERREAPRSRPGTSTAIIDTSFSMDVGETVVVGTSRLAGADKALIALLTAVPQKNP